MKISEVSEQTGMSISAIRYYEKSGLCPPIARGPDGKRHFSANDLDWFLLLASLRSTGMANSQMLEFAKLYQDGSKTIAERKAMLLLHSNRLNNRQKELDDCRSILARKLEKYDEILETGK